MNWHISEAPESPREEEEEGDEEEGEGEEEEEAAKHSSNIL